MPHTPIGEIHRDFQQLSTHVFGYIPATIYPCLRIHASNYRSMSSDASQQLSISVFGYMASTSIDVLKAMDYTNRLNLSKLTFFFKKFIGTISCWIMHAIVSFFFLQKHKSDGKKTARNLFQNFRIHVPHRSEKIQGTLLLFRANILRTTCKVFLSSHAAWTNSKSERIIFRLFWSQRLKNIKVFELKKTLLQTDNIYSLADASERETQWKERELKKRKE